ncbi:MAG: hypothetical protein V2A74_05035 [bacterium]
MKKWLLAGCVAAMTLGWASASFGQTAQEPKAYRFEEKNAQGQTVVPEVTGYKVEPGVDFIFKQEGEDTHVERIEYTLEEKKKRDDEELREIWGEMQTKGWGANQQGGQQQGGNDPRAEAEWRLFYRQVELWQRYLEESIFFENLQAPPTFDPTGVFAEVGNEQIPGTLFRAAERQAVDIGQHHHEIMVAYFRGLDERENQRLRYQEWLTDRQREVIEYADNWSKRLDGSQVKIEGTLYLISPKPLDHIPRGSVNVVTDKLTPYDLLNSDGTVKQPEN